LIVWQRASARVATEAAVEVVPVAVAADPAAVVGEAVAPGLGAEAPILVEERAAAGGGGDFDDDAPQLTSTPTTPVTTSDTSILSIRSTSPASC
jgi:hypothetical protein